MSSDGVLTAFEIIMEEIDEVADEIKQDVRATLDEKGFGDAETLIVTGKRLESVYAKVEELKEEWITSFDEDTRQRTQLEVSQHEPESSSSQSEESEKEEVFVDLVIKNGEARARVNGFRRLVLQPKSTVCKTELPSLSKALRERRASWFAEGSLKEVPGKDLYEVVSPITFRSPSAAAKFVSASSINGADQWVVDGENMSFGAWKRRQRGSYYY